MTVPVVPSRAVAGPRRAGDRHRTVGVVPLVLIGLAILAAVAGMLAYRHGIASSPFPSSITDAPDYHVDRYSGPWVVGGVVLTGSAVTLLVVGIALGVRRRRIPLLTSPDVTDEW